MRILGSKIQIEKEIKEAEIQKENILKELKLFLNGDIDIKMYVEEYPLGYSSAAELLVNGELCRKYSPADICFLELSNLMLKLMLEDRARNERR